MIWLSAAGAEILRCWRELCVDVMRACNCGSVGVMLYGEKL